MASPSAWAASARPSRVTDLETPHFLESCGRPVVAVYHAPRGRGAALRTERIAAEPGWHFVSNPPWRSPELVNLTVEWLDALA